MRLPLSWLAEFVDLPADAELVERLNMGGFEDAAVEATGPDLGAVRVGRVSACEPHPGADRLRVCTVDVGEEGERRIVCGAPNVAAGQKVAVALPGSRLPDGTKLKKTKLRGVVSEGMICSTRELGLGDEHEGILVLDPEAPVGAALPDVVATGGRVLEVGITPNRGDTASVLGLAREVRAFFGGALRLPPVEPEESGAPASEAVRLSIEAGDGCYHYVARVVRGIRVGPSPDWLKGRLEAAGIRSINNVVDVTNHVLLEFGQPLHGFDLARLRGGEIRVRRARPGETLRTLDGQERKLDPGDLLIADAEGGVALAGVMGGADSEVSDATRDVLIESAHFEPLGVRRAARRHGLHSEASYRFERGVDPEGVARAADRAARLLAELAGGQVAAGRVEARGHAAPRTAQIALSAARANRLLGTAIAADEAAALLERVGIACTRDGDRIEAVPPSHRNDVHGPHDLVEEIARIYGYENIPATLPVAQLSPVGRPRSWELAERARDALSASGLIETLSFPFVQPAELEALRFEEGDPRRTGLRLLNPIQEQDSVLRTAIAPSLLRLVRQNLSRQADRVRLFEVSRVFVPRGGSASEQPDEPLWAAAVLTAGRDKRLWEPEIGPPLFFEAKGVAERLLTAMGYVACLRPGGGARHLHPGAQASIEVEGHDVGALGELHPEVATAFEIDAPCALIELNLTALDAVKTREIQFREVSREPQVRRDIAVLLDRGQSAGEVLEAIRKAGGADLISVELFDRYEGKGVPEGRVSLAFRLVFQRADRTLTDAEVTKATDRVVRTLTGRFGAELR